MKLIFTVLFGAFMLTFAMENGDAKNSVRQFNIAQLFPLFTQQPEGNSALNPFQTAQTLVQNTGLISGVGLKLPGSNLPQINPLQITTGPSTTLSGGTLAGVALLLAPLLSALMSWGNPLNLIALSFGGMDHPKMGNTLSMLPGGTSSSGSLSSAGNSGGLMSGLSSGGLVGGILGPVLGLLGSLSNLLGSGSSSDNGTTSSGGGLLGSVSNLLGSGGAGASGSDEGGSSSSGLLGSVLNLLG